MTTLSYVAPLQISHVKLPKVDLRIWLLVIRRSSMYTQFPSIIKHKFPTDGTGKQARDGAAAGTGPVGACVGAAFWFGDGAAAVRAGVDVVHVIVRLEYAR
jgi:hypothetical protein